MRSTTLILSLFVLLAFIVVSSDAVDLNICKYCKYCKECRHCNECPCTDRENCKFCKYCKACSVCSVCSSCKKGGFLESLTSFAEKWGLASYVADVDLDNLDEELKTLKTDNGPKTIPRVVPKAKVPEPKTEL
ncbi:hypothetical protein PROFUN_03009 [Planoprotostelium fungivorum]|uniref:TNFR-Cys domain-containing protein n=1 Tax=Planoprotostelium fungivorum TaxID=1890364 RepID=A0A2P6NXG5_9EUKA|nr:hypothetical protein PROFUN_03009 [Planoprotostelium fungivorum]